MFIKPKNEMLYFSEVGAYKNPSINVLNLWKVVRDTATVYTYDSNPRLLYKIRFYTISENMCEWFYDNEKDWDEEYKRVINLKL